MKTARTPAWHSLGFFGLRWRCFQQLVEQRPVMHQSLSKLFRSCFSCAIPRGYSTCRAIVLYYFRIVDRQVRRGLLKVGHGITALFHNFEDLPMALLNRRLRVVDKSILNCRPCFPVMSPIL